MNKVLFSIFLLFSAVVQSQALRPGFDKREYLQLLQEFSRWGDSSVYKAIPASKVYKKKTLKYHSEEMGLQNCWKLYETSNHAVISIRGTTEDQTSWLANFYAAMIPAKGNLQLSDSISFDYHFADHPKAAVHVGWSISSAYLLIDILPKIQAVNKKGVREFIIFGHSQGAALAYYITAQLKYYQKTGVLPKDMIFKTYCSAAPKPGNLYFAYDYEASTQSGWSISVVNPADWVPELPVSIQTPNDFNETSPFKNAKKVIRKLPFPKNVMVSYMYKQLTKHNRKAVKRYQFFLGKFASKIISKQLKGFKDPEYFDSNNYVRTGNMHILPTDDEYFKKFPDSEKTLFVHHNIKAYLYLTDKPEHIATTE
ncbi:MAG TPA: lipase family protein [Flavobacterium sp.]